MKIRVLLLLVTLAEIFAASDPVRAQWERMYTGPNGVLDAGLLFAIGNHLFAADASRGVYNTSDYGYSWTFLGDNDSAIIPVVIVGNTVFGKNAHGVYRSTDGASTWEWLSNNTWPQGFFSYLFQGSKLFAYGDGIYISFDTGKQWTKVDNGIPRSYINGFVVSDSRLIANTCCDSGIFVSTDNGTSWIVEHKDFGRIQSLALSIGSRVFMGSYSSTDYGKNWTRGGLPGFLNNFIINSDSLFVGCANGTFLSIDSGQSWRQLALDHAQAYSMAIVDSFIFEGTASGLWRYSFSDPNGNSIVAPDLQIDGLFAIGRNLFSDGAMSSDQGKTWKGHGQKLYFDQSQVVVAGYAGIEVSKDAGTTWSPAFLPSDLRYTSFVRSGKYWFVASDYFGSQGVRSRNVFRSTDEGQSWSVVFNMIPNVVYGTITLFDGNRLIYAGSVNDVDYACYVSTNYGSSWQFLDSVKGFGNGPFTPKGLCCAPPQTACRMDSSLLGLDSGRLFRSLDGMSWQSFDIFKKVPGSLTGIAFSESKYFVCLNNGDIFYTSDSGLSWNRINDNIPDSTISFLAVSDKFLFGASKKDQF